MFALLQLKSTQDLKVSGSLSYVSNNRKVECIIPKKNQRSRKWMWLVISIVAIVFSFSWFEASASILPFKTSLSKVLKVLSQSRQASAAMKKLSDVFSPRHFTVMERKESLLFLTLRLNTITSDNFYDHQTLRKIFVNPSWKRRRI